MKFVINPKRLIWVVLLFMVLTSCTEFKEDDFAHAYRQAIWQEFIHNEIAVSNVSFLLEEALTDGMLPAQVTSLDWEDLLEKANTITRDSTDVVSQLTVEQAIEMRSHKQILAIMNVNARLNQLYAHVMLTNQFGTSLFTELQVSTVEEQFAEAQIRIEEAVAVLGEFKATLSKP